MAWKDYGKNGYNSVRRFQKGNSGSNYGSSSFGLGSKGSDGKYKKSRIPRIVGNVGRASSNAALMTTGAWAHMSLRMRGLIAFVLVIAVMFVPFGIFQYAGWSMYLVFTWVINSFYWFVATIINAILNMFITSIDTIFKFVTEQVGGVYQPLGSWTLSRGTLLSPDVFKPTTFDTRYLLQWVWDAFGGTLTDMFAFLKK